ncbi:hypothetical protein HDZ31DRAFT_65417 [Schizophyllum fasciatum]
MPTTFAIALEQVAGEDQKRDDVLWIARGSAVIAMFYVTTEALTNSLEGRLEWLASSVAEHVTADFVTYRNEVNLALAVSINSCTQDDRTGTVFATSGCGSSTCEGDVNNNPAGLAEAYSVPSAFFTVWCEDDRVPLH